MRLGVDLVGEEKSITHTCDAINCSRLAGLGVYLSPFLMWVDNLLTLFRCLFWMDVWLDDDLRGESGLVIVCVCVCWWELLWAHSSSPRVPARVTHGPDWGS